MSTQLLIRIDPELKKQVERLAKTQGKNTSALVREVLEAHIRESDIGAHIDALWDGIGQALTGAGVTAKDVNGAIREVRKARR